MSQYSEQTLNDIQEMSIKIKEMVDNIQELSTNIQELTNNVNQGILIAWRVKMYKKLDRLINDYRTIHIAKIPKFINSWKSYILSNMKFINKNNEINKTIVIDVDQFFNKKKEELILNIDEILQIWREKIIFNINEFYNEKKKNTNIINNLPINIKPFIRFKINFDEINYIIHNNNEAYSLVSDYNNENFIKDCYKSIIFECGANY